MIEGVLPNSDKEVKDVFMAVIGDLKRKGWEKPTPVGFLYVMMECRPNPIAAAAKYSADKGILIARDPDMFFHSVMIKCLHNQNQNNPRKPNQPEERIVIDAKMDNFFNDVKIEALGNNNKIDMVVLTKTLFKRGSETESILSSCGMSESDFLDAMADIGQSYRDEDGDEVSGTPILDKVGVNLNELVVLGGIDPAIGRGEDTRRLVEILARKKKSNPLLVGPPGIGKTAIVENLARLIVAGKVPDRIKGLKIFSIDTASLIAGAGGRGAFEEKMTLLVKEIESKKGEIVVFIDEIHTLVGLGKASGDLDASNILKPALARGSISLIGATTDSEYKKSIERNKALARRLQKMDIKEPTNEETFLILKSLHKSYGKYHGVQYTKESLQYAVDSASKYLTNKFNPDKAIDLIDEAGARKSISNLKNKVVRVKDIAFLIERSTGIPAKTVMAAEGASLMGMEERLNKAVINQEEAISVVSRAIRRNRAGMRNEKKPIANLLFLGPTGVGKTETVKALSKELFEGRENIVRLDMSEYMHSFNVSRLIGSPPGYVGSDEGGQLTEKIKKNPYSIVLLDEFEKAHQDVYNIFLSIFDEGEIEDARGEKVNFKNCVFVATSNLGSRHIIKDKTESSIGFADTGGVMTKEEMNAKIMAEVNEYIRPEFLNRFDELVIFNKLEKSDIKSILNIQINELKNMAEKAGYNLDVKESVEDRIIRDINDMKFGARPIKRKLEKVVGDKVAEFIINNPSSKNGDLIDINVECDDEDTVIVSEGAK